MKLQVLKPHEKDHGGGFMVRRLIPALDRRAIGPFVFFDHFGPIVERPEDRHDVRPHPHIGLATVTYLFEGAIDHRDSTGAVQRIEPGAINLMAAGRGIVHSERRPPDMADRAAPKHGLQLWMALPAENEQDPPNFDHTPAHSIPVHEREGVTARVLIGSAHGLESPVPTLSPTLYVDYRLAPGGCIELPDATERLLYGVDGAFEVDGEPAQPCTGLVLPSGTVRLAAREGARVVLIGGDSLGPRHIWWNFVATRKELILEAAQAWEAGGIGDVPGDPERMPLPDKRPH
jgi:redox-sensitive bicupin YhaK (pirin superfamily)